ncbi:uncharacterized protein Neto isoform X2 [Eurosta solidaginis]|uniref:uncharacterized protein Neto isoform X2 n=1 Tax=Eurosta solidaginis TaxID=178769 RepID=UPI003530A838
MMKHQGSSYCYCWFTLILVATGIVLVSPDIHTTFADNKRQTTKATGSQATTATTTLNTMRTIKTLESIGFIDANRYNANKYNHSSNNNNNNVNSYNISMDVVYSIRGNNNKNSSMNVKKNNLKSKRTNIDIPIDGAWSERLKEELEHIEQFELLEQSKERRAEHDAEHMLSTPQTMTIIVEEPTMIKHATTTIATSKPTTAITMTTTATNVIHTHSDSAIKMPTPANSANINVNGIKKDSMIYKQMSSCKQHEQQKQEPAKEKRTQQHWPNWQEERQRQQRLQRQSKAQSTWSSRKEQKSQTNVAISGLGSKTVTTTTTTAPMNTDARLTKATLQMQMAINSSNNSTLNFYSNTANKTLIQTTTVPTMLTTASNATITTTTTKKSQSQSFINISYYKTATNNNGNNIKSKVAQEADVKMVVAGLETTAAVEVDMEMEVDRQYQHKFSSSYLDENESNNKTNNKHNSVDVEHNYALRWQETPTALPLALLHTQHSNRWTRQLPADEEEPVDKCRQFIEGEGEKNEFYSPDYPNDYPKNINCTRKIIAPRGQIIRLDFRNSFHIEAKEDCKFDFLEIRDGQYGFSPLIGKFCGTDFPPEITSKERYLWLHFHSDESIEYSGFTAVYEFIDRSKEAPTTDLNCTIEKDGFEGFVNSSDVPYDIRETVIRTKIPLDCIWRIQVQDNWKIQVKFLDFKLSKPNDCDTNFLDIFPEKTVMPLRLKNFCGSAGEGITSESNVLNLRFFAEPAAINSTFAILYTAFRDRGAACTEDEYDCEDATCISQELKCNQRDNCKFRWDEEGCDKQSSEQSEHMIIIMIVFGLILGGMIVTFLVNCIRKIMHDQKIIRELPLPHANDIYHIDSFIWDAPKTAIFVGLQNDLMSEDNWQLQQQPQQQQSQQKQQCETYMLQQSNQPHPHGNQLEGNFNGPHQTQSQSNGPNNNNSNDSGNSGNSGSALSSYYCNQQRGIGSGDFSGCHSITNKPKQDGNDNLYKMHGFKCDNTNGSSSAYAYHPNVVNFNDDEFVIVTNRNGLGEYPLCNGSSYQQKMAANGYGYDVTPISTDSITSSKSSPTIATN